MASVGSLLPMEVPAPTQAQPSQDGIGALQGTRGQGGCPERPAPQPWAIPVPPGPLHPGWPAPLTNITGHLGASRIFFGVSWSPEGRAGSFAAPVRCPTQIWC